MMRFRDEGWGDADRDPSRVVRVAIENGVEIFDTAEMYGNEAVVGRALAGRRDEVTLCTKFGVYRGESGDPDDWSVRADPETVRAAIDGSLTRLGVDHVDLYYLHHRSDETPIEETVGAMADLLRAGKIGALGLSNVTVDDIRRAHAVHPIRAVQQSWSLADRAVESMLPVLGELGITLVAHSPMHHGGLPTGEGSPLADAAARYGLSASQVALAWVHNRARRLGVDAVTLPGSRSVTHLLENVAAARVDLGEDVERSLASTHDAQS